MFTLNRRSFALLAVVSLAFGAFQDGRARADVLTRGASSDDADVTGQVRTLRRSEGDRLVVSVANVTPGRALVAVAIDADGQESSLGNRIASNDGRAFWSADTALGESLPFGASSLDPLVGLTIVVRDANDPTVVLLGGSIPQPLTAVVDQEGREGIPRADAAPEDAGAHVRIAHRTGPAAREVFSVGVTGLDEGMVVNVWLEVPGQTGVFEIVGTLTVGEDHEGEMEQSTSDGESLPFDVASVTSLVGLHIQVRDADGVVLFAGAVPTLASN